MIIFIEKYKNKYINIIIRNILIFIFLYLHIMINIINIKNFFSQNHGFNSNVFVVLFA